MDVIDVSKESAGLLSSRLNTSSVSCSSLSSVSGTSNSLLVFQIGPDADCTNCVKILSSTLGICDNSKNSLISEAALVLAFALKLLLVGPSIVYCSAVLMMRQRSLYVARLGL